MAAKQAAAAAHCQLAVRNETQAAVLQMLQQPQEILRMVSTLCLRSELVAAGRSTLVSAMSAS